MGALFLVCRRMFFPQSQEVRNISVGELIDFRNCRPRFHHPTGHRSAQRRHFLPMNRSPFGEIDAFTRRRSLSNWTAWLFSARRPLKSDLLESLDIVAQITQIDSSPSFAAFDTSEIDTQVGRDLPY